MARKKESAQIVKLQLMCKASNPTIKLKLTGGSQCNWIRACCPQGWRDMGSRATQTNTVKRFQKENPAKLSRSRGICFLFHFDLLFAVFSMGIFNSANIPDEAEGDTALIDFTVKWLFTIIKAYMTELRGEALGGNWKGISNAGLNTALEKAPHT